MSIADKLVALGTKISNALAHANEELIAKGSSEASSLWEIGARIREIEVGGGGANDYSQNGSIIDNTIIQVSDNNVKKVADYKFQSCTSLTTVNLPACQTVGQSAFCSCTSLTTINLPVCSSIGSAAFYSCTSLTTINLPGCSYIPIEAFRGCFSLTSIYAPACINVQQNAFMYCSSLTSIDFPVCQAVGTSAFQNCISLTTVDLPVCITIYGTAFRSCTSLTILDLPACTSIGSSAFYYCKNLTTLILRASKVVTLAKSNAFTNTPIALSTLTGAFGSIYVPASLVASYQAATNWTYFSSRITAIVE